MKNVADIYPLTPLQSGMLFHTLSTDHQAQDNTSNQTNKPIRKGTYINQFTCLLQGELEPKRLQRAWAKTIERYPVLRTAILWEGLDEPLQVVRETVKLPWQQMDWRSHSITTQQQQLTDFLQRDRTQSFTLSKAPLIRLTLIQLTDNSYQFILTNHHLLYDGWSLLLIWQNVLNQYSADNTESFAPRPFKDYIAWQHQQNSKAYKTFWQNQLKDFTELTPLPAASPSTTTDNPYQQQSILLESTFTQQLTTFARQNRLTLNTLVQSAWALLLSHYTDGSRQRETKKRKIKQESKTTETLQVTYGSVVSGRPAALRGVEKMVGLFINTLPVCVSISPNQSLLPWLQDRQQQLLDIREYEATPLSDIQKWTTATNRQNSPLFESIVAFENITTENVAENSPPDLSFRISNQQYLEQSNYPLALLVFPQQNNSAQNTLDLRLLYDTDQFEPCSITQLLNHLKQLLAAFITNPKAKLFELPRLTEQEQTQLTQFSRITKNDQGQYIHQLIEAQAANSPNKLALTYNNQSLTYQALNQQANQLAHLLRSRNITSNSRVAICLDRSLDMIVSILAVLKAGGTYVPLDPNYPNARINYCLSDTNPQLLITHSKIASNKKLQTPSSCTCLYTDQETTKTYPTTNPNNNSQLTDLAYIIYTSGSTGQPKGVMVTYANLLHSTTARFEVYKNANQQPFIPERFLLLSSIAFDSSIAGIFWTLSTGGELVLSPRRIEQDLNQLADLIAYRQITCTLCVPTLYSLLLSTPSLQAKLTSLKTVIVAGEACSRTLVQRHYQHLPTTSLYNEYGPTEASVWCSAYRVPPQLPPGGPVSIGTPIPNTQIYMLTTDLKPVPLGAIGEICICGNGITSGYLNQAEKTAAAFTRLTHHPITKKPFPQPVSLYKTGDFGRYRPDGTVEWLGRCDRQVKIRGYRIELSEIEEALRSQPGVQDAVVIAQPAPKPTQNTHIQNTTVTTTDTELSALISALEALPTSQAETLLSSVEATETTSTETASTETLSKEDA